MSRARFCHCASDAIAGDADAIFQLTKPKGGGAGVRRLQATCSSS
jgi:hypothetical protein